MVLPMDEHSVGAGHTDVSQPVVLLDPSALVAKAEALLRMDTWPELVVGVGLSTGRSVSEVLQTGVFAEKTAYSLLFSRPATHAGVLYLPMQIPTLTSADLVAAAVSTLRHRFTASNAVSDALGGGWYLTQIDEVIVRHLSALIAFSPTASNLYREVSQGVYPRLAVLYYCPPAVDDFLYMATIQYCYPVIQATLQKEHPTGVLVPLYHNYVIGPMQGTVDSRRGVRLGAPGVEPLDIFTSVEISESQMEEHQQEGMSMADVVSKTLSGPEHRKLGRYRRSVEIFASTLWSLEAIPVKQHLVFTTLFAVYDWVYTSGLLEQVQRLASTVLMQFFPSFAEQGMVEAAMKQTGVTEPLAFARKALLSYASRVLKPLEPQPTRSLARPIPPSRSRTGNAKKRKAAHVQVQREAAPESPKFVDFDAEAKKIVSLLMTDSEWKRLMKIKAEQGCASDDDVIEFLCATYDLFACEPVALLADIKLLASTALSHIQLHHGDQEMLKEVMASKQVSHPFDFLQETVLTYGAACITEEEGEEL
jgi:hypothetical protein